MAVSKNKVAFFNAKIRPFADFRQAEAILIDGGKIVSIGQTNQVLANCDNNVQKIDLKGRTVLPGFYDSHIHLMETSKVMDETWLGNVNSIEEMIEIGRKEAQTLQRQSEWILGRGWDQEKFPGKAYPSRYDLDK